MGLWKVIRSEWKEFHKRVEFKVRNGRRVRSWKDGWCDEDSLEAFPELFSIGFAEDA